MIDRLPPLAPEALTPSQREACDRIVAGPRGALVGPFIPLLRCPELMTRVQEVGAQLRYRGVLPAAVRELAILFVARAWDQSVEWQIHAPLGERAGLSRATLDDLAAGRDPGDLGAAERDAYRFARELEVDRRVSDATYGSALARFGEAGVVELTAILGYYTLLAMVMNVAGTVPPDPTAPRLDRLAVRFPAT